MNEVVGIVGWQLIMFIVTATLNGVAWTLIFLAHRAKGPWTHEQNLDARIRGAGPGTP